MCCLNNIFGDDGFIWLLLIIIVWLGCCNSGNNSCGCGCNNNGCGCNNLSNDNGCGCGCN